MLEKERESSSIALHFSAKDVHEEREMRSAQSSELGKKRSRCSDEPDRGVVKKDEVDCDDRTPFRLTRDSFVVREVIPPIPKEPWNFAVCQPEVANADNRIEQSVRIGRWSWEPRTVSANPAADLSSALAQLMFRESPV